MADRIDISATVRAIDQASGPLRSIANQIKSVGDIAKTAGASLAKMATQPFGSVSQNLRGVQTAVGNLAGRFGALAGPLGAFIGIAGIGGAVAAMKDYIARARQIQKISISTGASPEMVQTWRYLVGDVEAADKSLLMLQKNLANFATKGGKATERIAEPLRKMGINLADVRSGAIGMDEILPKLAAGFQKNTNETSRAAVATALFGKAGLQMIPFLSQGTEGIDKAWQALQRYGYITTENIKTSDDARTAWKEMTLATNGLKDAIVVALLPAFTPLIKGTRDWIAENKTAIVTGMTTAVKGLGDGLKLVWKGIEKVVGLMGGWENAAIALGAVFAVSLLPEVWELTKSLAKLGASVVFNPITLGAAGLAAAAITVRRNWGTIGPWLEANLPPAAQRAFTGVANWAQSAQKDIVAGWKKGGIVGALTAGVISAGKAIYNNWDEISQFLQETFPEISAAAKTAWANIETWWGTSVKNIKTAWEQGGLLAAMEATWEAAKIGATGMWTAIRDAWKQIRWEDVGTSIGNAIKSGAATVSGFTDWLRDQPWEDLGTWIGEKIGDLLTIELGKDHPEWIDAVARTFVNIVDTGLEIGLKLAQGILQGLANKLIEGLKQIPGGQLIIDTLGFIQAGADKATAAMDRLATADITGLGRRMGWGDQDWSGAVTEPLETAVKNGVEGGMAGAQIIPFPTRGQAAGAPLPPPLAPAAGPTVAQPNVLQGMKEIPVRLAGEIAQRLKIDMSPDLRAMLQENKTRIDQLGVQIRSGVDVGVTMGPAMGEAA